MGKIQPAPGESQHSRTCPVGNGWRSAQDEHVDPLEYAMTFPPKRTAAFIEMAKKHPHLKELDVSVFDFGECVLHEVECNWKATVDENRRLRKAMANLQ